MSCHYLTLKLRNLRIILARLRERRRSARKPANKIPRVFVGLGIGPSDLMCLAIIALRASRKNPKPPLAQMLIGQRTYQDSDLVQPYAVTAASVMP